MNVTQCDICRNIVKNQQSMFLQVFKVKSNNSVRVMTKDICLICWEKLNKLITPKEDNNVEQKHTEKITDEIE